MQRIAVFLSLSLVAGCGVFKTEVTRQYAESDAWKATSKDTATLYTTADIRIVTKRKHPVLGNDVMCTEPSPDVSKALSAVTTLNAGVKEGAVNASAGVGAGTSEELVQLAGRTTALLAFRDGVFRACEAYANGSLGANLYTLVAGNYTQLLTTLFLAQDMTGVVGTPGGATGMAPTIGLGTLEAASGGTGAASGAGAGAGAGTGKPAVSGDGSAVKAAATSSAGAATPAAAASPAALEATKDAPATLTVPAGAGVNLVRMNEDYLGAAYNFPAALFLLCVNENDPTRLNIDYRTGKPLSNTYLREMCAKLQTPEDMRTLLGAYTEFVKAMQQAAPSVNPNLQATLSGGQPKTPSSPPTTSGGGATSPSSIKAAQQALNRTACKGIKADGVFGPATRAALECFQRAHDPKIAVSGELDPATVDALGIKTP